MNGIIRRKLIEAERPPLSIEQWYKYTTNLNRYWRKSRKEEEQQRGKREQGKIASRQQQQQAPRPLLWQLLDQYSIAVLQVNLKADI